MDFKSIDEIISKFNLDSNDGDEIKKQLKLLIKEIHPDKNSGNFRNKEDEDLFHDVQSAIEFIDSQHSKHSLITRTEIASLTKVLNEIVSTRKEQTHSQVIERKDASLSVKLQDSVQSFHKRHTTPKISSAVVTIIMTALWTFPSLVKEHPLLSFLYTYYKEFTIFWVGSLVFTGLIWIRIRASERHDEEIKKSYKLEATQNYIFSLFVKWLRNNPRHFDIRDKKLVIKFSKDNMMDFLTTRYNLLTHYLGRTTSLNDYEITERIQHFEEDKVYRHMRLRTPFSILNSILPTPGQIDLEIAQLISDLTIERLLNKGLLQKVDGKSLSDLYEYEDDY